jgi:hypothetical protein
METTMTTKQTAALSNYRNLQSMLRAAALAGNMAEVERLNAEVNRAWRKVK